MGTIILWINIRVIGVLQGTFQASVAGSFGLGWGLYRDRPSKLPKLPSKHLWGLNLRRPTLYIPKVRARRAQTLNACCNGYRVRAHKPSKPL